MTEYIAYMAVTGQYCLANSRTEPVQKIAPLGCPPKIIGAEVEEQTMSRIARRNLGQGKAQN